MHVYIDLPALIIHQPASRRKITPPNGNNVSTVSYTLCMVAAISYTLTDYTDSYIFSYVFVCHLIFAGY